MAADVLITLPRANLLPPAVFAANRIGHEELI